MKKKQCKELLKVTGDKCSFCTIGRFEIVCENMVEKYYYLQCNNWGEFFEG